MAGAVGTGTSTPARGDTSAWLINGAILAGAALLVVSIFLEWQTFNLPRALGSRSVSLSESVRLYPPVVAAAVVATAAVLLPLGRFRYALVLTAPAAMGSFLYFWFVILFDSIGVEPAVGVWVLTIGAVLVMLGGLTGLATQSRDRSSPLR
jgi:hypothetical protein